MGTASNLTRGALASLAILATAAPARAQTDPTFTKPEAVQAEDKVTGKVGADFGMLLTAGNSHTLTLSSGANLEVKRQRNRFRLVYVGALALGDLDADGKLDFEEERTAFRVAADVRYDRFLTTRVSLYVLGGVLHDPFQHLRVRPHVQVGVSREFVNTGRHLLVGELGVDYALESYGYYVAGETEPETNPVHIVAGRLYGKYALTIAPAFQFSQELEGLPGYTSDPTRRLSVRLASITALTAQITEGVGIKVGMNALFNLTPPPETKPYDIAHTVSFVASRVF